MGCLTRRILGRNTALQIAIQCPENDPATTDFMTIGAVSTKSFTIDGNSLEANDSSNISGYTENQISTSSISLSVTGNYLRAGFEGANEIPIGEIIAYRFNSVKQDLSENPIILVRYAAPDYTLTAYMIVQSISVDGPDSEMATFSMELTNAPSPIYPPTYLPTPP